MSKEEKRFVPEILRDFGYVVLRKTEKGEPMLVLRLALLKGRYGDFLAFEKRWVRSVKEDGLETRWAKWTCTFPAKKGEARELLKAMAELLRRAMKQPWSEEEVVEGFTKEIY